MRLGVMRVHIAHILGVHRRMPPSEAQRSCQVTSVPAGHHNAAANVVCTLDPRHPMHALSAFSAGCITLVLSSCNPIFHVQLSGVAAAKLFKSWQRPCILTDLCGK